MKITVMNFLLTWKELLIPVPKYISERAKRLSKLNLSSIEYVIIWYGVFFTILIFSLFRFGNYARNFSVVGLIVSFISIYIISCFCSAIVCIILGRGVKRE